MKRTYTQMVHHRAPQSKARTGQEASRRIENVCERLRLSSVQASAALPKPLPSLQRSPSMEIRLFALFTD